MNQADIQYWLHESPDAKLEAAIDAAEHRDELIAEKRDELIEQRLAALSDDDIRCGMEHVDANMAANIRQAIKEERPVLALALLKIMVRSWINVDSEVEAIKYIERLESADHPARH